MKSNISSPWWRIEKYLKWNDSQIAKLILILLSRRKLISVEKAHVLANEECGVTVAGTGLNNRMNALLVKLTRDSVTRQCPLIWIIYMQYCAQYQDVQKCKDVFYMALENCPWIKVSGVVPLLNRLTGVYMRKLCAFAVLVHGRRSRVTRSCIADSGFNDREGNTNSYNAR